MPDENNQNSINLEQRVETLEKNLKKVQMTAGIALGLAMTAFVFAFIF